ncbi:universal stress protein [Natronomonas sp.]|jgi:nucleotide-binding universal stress UspA family protein|uniref:universal stress protein n=1 Tax=Natronomonas sp. TaxID=2184060 RepID=UPI003989908B
MYQSVLVAVDGRNQLPSVTDTAFAVAESFDARLYALFVMNTQFTRSSRWMEEYEETGDEVLAEISRAAKARSIPMEACLRRGRLAGTAIEYVEEHSIDLIVVGEREQSPIEQWFIRTPSQKLVRNSPVSVLTVCGADEPVDSEPPHDSSESVGQVGAER